MRILPIFILILLAAAPSATAQTGHPGAGSNGAAIEEIKALEEARNQAVLHGDVAALDRMTSDDCSSSKGKSECIAVVGLERVVADEK